MSRDPKDVRTDDLSIVRKMSTDDGVSGVTTMPSVAAAPRALGSERQFGDTSRSRKTAPRARLVAMR